MLDALSKIDSTGIEQNRVALLKNSKDGLSKIDTVKDFRGDASLKNAANQSIKFFNEEAEVKIPILTDFLSKKENFQKLKSAYYAKPESKRTDKEKEDLDKALGDVNQALNKYYTTNQEINKERYNQSENWNKTVSDFLLKYLPK